MNHSLPDFTLGYVWMIVHGLQASLTPRYAVYGGPCLIALAASHPARKETSSKTGLESESRYVVIWEIDIHILVFMDLAFIAHVCQCAASNWLWFRLSVVLRKGDIQYYTALQIPTANHLSSLKSESKSSSRPGPEALQLLRWLPKRLMHQMKIGREEDTLCAFRTCFILVSSISFCLSSFRLMPLITTIAPIIVRSTANRVTELVTKPSSVLTHLHICPFKAEGSAWLSSGNVEAARAASRERRHVLAGFHIFPSNKLIQKTFWCSSVSKLKSCLTKVSATWMSSLKWRYRSTWSL